VKMKPRPLIRTLGTVFVMVLLMTMLTRCGKTFRDSPPTNPLRTGSPPVSATYYTDDREEVTVRLDVYEQVDTLLSIFDDSQEDPHPAKWVHAGGLTLTDDEDGPLSIALFTAGVGEPDAYRVNGVYYRKPGLTDALETWANAHQPAEEAHTDAP